MPVDDGADTTAPVGALLLKDRYRLGRQLGEGGFATVYLANDQLLHDRQVVVKLLRIDQASHGWSSEKFAGELKALSRINHPGVVTPLDHGVTANGRPFIVVQFIDGISLEDALTRNGLSLIRSARILRELSYALAAAHDQGVWHRDLKPANVMLERHDGDERVRLIDFGIATVQESMRESEVSTRVAGSLPYMAPEQLAGRVSAAADVFAYGVVAYELLTGRRPFSADDVVSLRQQHAEGVALKPKVLRAEISTAAERLILNALAFDPEDRPPDIRGLGDRLYAALTVAPVANRRGSRRLVAMAGITASVVAASALFWPSSEYQNEPLSTSSTVSYSLMVQPLRDGQPFGAPSFAPSAYALRPGEGFYLIARALRAGHLYVFAESGRTGALTMLFPAPHMYNGSSLLRAATPTQIPEHTWFSLGEQDMSQRLRFVWAESMIPQLEAAMAWGTMEHKGVIDDAAAEGNLRALFDRILAAGTAATSDSSTETTVTVSAPQVTWTRDVSPQTRRIVQ